MGRRTPPSKPRAAFLTQEWSLPFGGGREKELFAENLSLLVDSGMGMLGVISALKRDVKSAGMRRVVARLEEDVESGSSLWQAFARAKLFPDHVIALIRVGERAGRLTENLRVIARAQEKEREFKNRLRSAMLYPVFVLTVAVVVGIGIAWFILPNLAKVFEEMEIALPLITRALLALGGFLDTYGAVVLPVMIAVALGVLFALFVWRRTRFLGQAILFRTPGVRRLLQEVELSRMGYIMGSLLDAGLTVTDALEAMGSASALRPYRAFYERLRGNISDGLTFQQSFARERRSGVYIYPALQHLLIAGEHSGGLAKAFAKIGDLYSTKTESTTKNLAVILEPILLVIVWLGVLAVALAVILPIYSLIGGFNTDPGIAPPAVTEVKSGPNDVVKEDVRVEEVSETPVPEATVTVLENALGYVNVRGEPSTAGLLLTRVNVGETMMTWGATNGWYRVVLADGTEGWVSGAYVEANE